MSDPFGFLPKKSDTVRVTLETAPVERVPRQVPPDAVGQANWFQDRTRIRGHEPSRTPGAATKVPQDETGLTGTARRAATGWHIGNNEAGFRNWCYANGWSSRERMDSEWRHLCLYRLGELPATWLAQSTLLFQCAYGSRSPDEDIVLRRPGDRAR